MATTIIIIAILAVIAIFAIKGAVRHFKNEDHEN